MESFKEKEEPDRKAREAGRERLRQLERERDQAAASAGMESGASSVWSWAGLDPDAQSLDVWERMANALLSPDVAEALTPVPWSDEYDRWTGSEDARQAAKQAGELARDLPARLERVRTEVGVIGARRRRLDETHRACSRQGIRGAPVTDPNRLRNWQRLHAERVGLRPTFRDWWPWSPRRRNEKALQEIEAELRRLPQLSTQVWSRIGVLDHEGRGRLGSVIDDLLAVAAAADAWRRTREEREAVEGALEPLRGALVQLGLPALPPAAELDGWSTDPLLREAASLERIARKAGRAWAAKERRDRTREQIRATVHEWRQLRDSAPVVRVWARRRGRGRELDQALEQLNRYGDGETLRPVRELLRAGVLDDVRTLWLGVVDRHRRCEAQVERIEQLPEAGVRLREWWNECPSPQVIPIRRGDRWPALEEARSELQGVVVLCEQRKKFLEETTPNQENRRKAALAEARRYLAVYRHAVPEADVKELLSQLDRALDGGDTAQADRLGEDVRRAVSRSSADRIRSRIQRIDSELRKHHFQLSRKDWRDRLWSDREAYNALQDLHAAMRRSDGALPDEALGSFRAALPLVPNWIVTSRSTQALPMAPGLFDLVVVDEASQCTLTDLLPLLFRGKRLVVIGDQEQLPAIHHVQLEEERTIARKHGVQSFLNYIAHARTTSYDVATDALPGRQTDVVQLDEHYRSDARIIGFSNRFIYRGRLKLRTAQDVAGLPFRYRGVVPKSVAGTATRGPRGRSWRNRDEARAVVDWIQRFKDHDELRHLTFGVVTPFRAQKDEIETALRALPEASAVSDIRVGTAHAFQGDERHVMVFSPVVARGITPGAVRFVEEPHNLVNVAWTRARRLLVVVADLDFLRQQTPGKILHRMWEYCDGIRKLQSVEEGQLFNLMLLEGLKPRIQARIGDSQVDFLIPDRRLVVEVDGDQHQTSREADRARDAFLRSQGYDVMRIPARDVRNVPHDVIRRIRKRLDD